MDDNSRVNYFEGQFLRTQDFTEEQAYHIAMRRRHNIAHHTWGIARGLDLCLEKPDQFFIRAGMAVDGYGRELILPEQRPIAAEVFDNRGSDILDVYLVYDRVESDEAAAGYAGCEPGGEGSYYRAQERPIIRLLAGDPDARDRRLQPPGVPDGDVAFDASRTPPDSVLREWPVFLGQIRRNRADPKQPYNVDLFGRPYIGLVGETILTPSRQARVDVGVERVENGAIVRQFAVFLNPNNPAPQMDIQQNGDMTLRGHATIYGDVNVMNGAVDFALLDSPLQAQPWRIYGVDNNGTQQLRVEIQDGEDNEVVFGSWSQGKFTPCLTITGDCRVIVHGTLIVDRLVDESNQPINLEAAPLSEDAKRMALSSYVTGVGGASTLMDQFYRRLAQAAPPPPVILEAAAAPAEMARKMVENDIDGATALRDELDRYLNERRNG